MEPSEMLGLVLFVVAVYLAALFALRIAARPRETRSDLQQTSEGRAKTLVVMVHGLLGRKSLRQAVELTARTLPHADRLVIDYDGNRLTNLDPYGVADAIEREIQELVERNGYESIVLFGHSAGAALLRKAFVWGHGKAYDEDRERFGRYEEPRGWVDKVDRLVLLAGMNRGWSVSPRPREMTWPTYLAIRFGEEISRLFGIARFAMSMRSGSPFIADTRVQWIRLARSNEVVSGRRHFPQVIQLIGSLDDVVSREDGQDLMAARGTVFKTLPQTGHRDIAEALEEAGSPGAANRLRRIEQALLGQIAQLEPDYMDLPAEDRDVRRIIYIVHGIRDYGNWTDVIRSEVEGRCRAAGERVVVVNTKYGYFPMLPFITYSDRQRNVRRFVDLYTENLARYPNVDTVDFAGHSNGTYILASALQHYVTVRVRRIFFAGSVVPKHYPWVRLIDGERVVRVVNVVATRDWVVAIFPKLFEQIADWRKVPPKTGWLDLGAAGFRGFEDSAGSAAVNDLKFSPGAHSTGVDIADRRKLDAITAYLANGDEVGFDAFRTGSSQNAAIGFLSNVSPLVWMALVALLILIGVVILAAGGPWSLVAYVAIVVLLLNLV
jgi:pimeloyl-ACP methyl ester carboxylesterase